MAGLAQGRSALPFLWMPRNADRHRSQCRDRLRAGARVRRGPGALVRLANP